MKDVHDLIIKPILSEKSYDLIPTKKYTFLVAMNANKTQVKAAIEEIFGVKVKSVCTARKLGKMKRQGRTQGRRPDTKKAYVTLTKESKAIEFFESMAQ